MATLTSSRAASTFPVFQSHAAGLLCVAYGTYELASNPAAATIIEFCKLPAGATVVDGVVYAEDLDTHATEELDINIGWLINADEAANTDGFGNFGVWTGDAVAGYKPEAGTRLPFGGVLLTDGPKTFTAETTIAGTVVADAATGGTGTVTCVVYYVCD